MTIYAEIKQNKMFSHMAEIDSVRVVSVDFWLPAGTKSLEFLEISSFSELEYF